jgi:DNA-binding GntR family transcriptional regulator
MVDHNQRSLTKSGASVDRIITTVLGQISTGQLGPGEQLRQEDLAEELGVSRVPVREALHALAEQRVLVHQKHRGFFVAKHSSKELAQFARMLQLIEDEVVSSVEWPGPETLAHLRSLNERMLAVADDDDVADTFALNREFHFEIFALSPLTLMTDELERLWRLAQPYIVAEMIAPEARRRRVDEHEHIIERLVAHDRDGVVEAMQRHRRRSRRADQAKDATRLTEERESPGQQASAGAAALQPVRFLSARS